MAYFLGRDVDVYVTLEALTAATGIGIEDGSDYESATVYTPVCSMVASGTVAPSGTLFANTMESDDTVLASRVIALTGVDLSISVTDSDVGPFFGQASTQSVELRKDTVVTLTHKKADEIWDSIFNGPSNGQEFEDRILKSTDCTFASDTSLVCTSTADLRVGMYVVATQVPKGTVIASITNATTAVMSNAATTTGGSQTVGFLDRATFLRQGARFGIAYSGATATISTGRNNPKSYVSGATYAGKPSNAVNYGYRVHVRLKDAVEVYTVRNCFISGHTVSLNADGTSEETLELKSSVLALLYTGATNTFDTALSVVGEM